MRTTQTNPDGTEEIVYTNINKEALLDMQVDSVDPASPSTAGLSEITAYQYDSDGRLVATINPSAIDYSFYAAGPSAYEAYDDLGITEGGVLSGSGLIDTTTYYSTTSGGGAPGFVEADYIQQGSGGTPIEQDSYTYLANTDYPDDNTMYFVARGNGNRIGGQGGRRIGDHLLSKNSPVRGQVKYALSRFLPHGLAASTMWLGV
jgi:hypothetical protein